MSQDCFPEMEQFIALTFIQYWQDDHDDPYDVAELRLQCTSDEKLALLLSEIDAFFQKYSDQSIRRSLLRVDGVFPSAGDAFDAWLVAVRRRIVSGLGGTDSGPLQAPSTSDP